MDLSGKEFPVLIAQTGPLIGQRWVVNQTLVIGRDVACEIVVPDRQVSRYHARLMPAPDGIILEDLGSKNGTYCNGQRIEEPIVLQDGDTLQISIIQNFSFLSSDATMPLEAGAPVVSLDKPRRLRLESRSRRVWVGKQELTPPLSVPQFRLLKKLYDNPGQVVSRQDLITAIWSDQNIQGVSEQALDALVRRLRDRLTAIDPAREYIVTIRGHGLRLENK
jgi:pSer/pThr/pTyr-binding forkhead associated (FHA) protein